MKKASHYLLFSVLPLCSKLLGLPEFFSKAFVKTTSFLSDDCFGRSSLKYIRVSAFLSFAVLFLSVSDLNAQTFSKGVIKGKIIDEKSEGLPFVAIVIKNAVDSSMYKSILSDNQGVFSLDLVNNGNYFVELKMLGYATMIVPNVKVDELSPSVDLGVLQLKSSAINLKGVTIKGETPFIERRADKIIVNLDNNIISKGAPIMEVLNQLPGVRVTQDDQISLNGRSVTVFIGGKATPLSAEALASLLKGMSSTTIQKIELIAHPSAKYDAAGSGGIINIVKKKNSTEGLVGNIYGGYSHGRYGKHNGGLNLNLKNKGYNIFFNGDYGYNKYFIDSKLTSTTLPVNGMAYNETISQIDSKRDNRTFTPSLGVDFYLSKRTTLSLSGTEGIQLFHKNSNTSMSDLNSSSGDSFLNTAKNKSFNHNSSLHLLHQIDTLGKELTVDLDYFNYRNNSLQDNFNVVRNAQGTPDYSSDQLDQRGTLNLYSAKMDYSQPLKGKGVFEFGMKSSYVKSNNHNTFYDKVAEVSQIDLSSLDRFRYTENINAAYLSLNKEYKKLSYQVGLRAEHTYGKGEQEQTDEVFRRNYVELFPSLFLDYKLNDKHGLNFHLNRKIDRPTYENLNPLVRLINSTTFIQGNPDLKPTISYNSSITYSLKNQLMLTFDYSLHLRDFNYYTSPYDVNGATTTKPGNNKYTQYFNFIIAYQKKFNSWWTTSSNFQLSQQQFKTNINGYDLRSSGLLSFNFDTYQSFALNNKLNFMVLFRYQNRAEERTRVVENNYSLTAGVRRTIFGNRGSISVNVSDILNSFRNRYTENSVVLRQVWDYRYDTRMVRASFTYSFGSGKMKKADTAKESLEEKKRSTLKEN